MNKIAKKFDIIYAIDSSGIFDEYVYKNSSHPVDYLCSSILNSSKYSYAHHYASVRIIYVGKFDIFLNKTESFILLIATCLCIIIFGFVFPYMKYFIASVLLYSILYNIVFILKRPFYVLGLFVL